VSTSPKTARPGGGRLAHRDHVAAHLRVPGEPALGIRWGDKEVERRTAAAAGRHPGCESRRQRRPLTQATTRAPPSGATCTRISSLLTGSRDSIAIGSQQLGTRRAQQLEPEPSRSTCLRSRDRYTLETLRRRRGRRFGSAYGAGEGRASRASASCLASSESTLIPAVRCCGRTATRIWKNRSSIRELDAPG
jgi:hypothetical protein